MNRRCSCGMSPPGSDPTKADYEPSGHWPSCPAYDPLAGLTPTGRGIVEDFIRQSRELAAAHERLDIYAIPPGPIVERLEWWFQQDSKTLDQLVTAKEWEETGEGLLKDAYFLLTTSRRVASATIWEAEVREWTQRYELGEAETSRSPDAVPILTGSAVEMAQQAEAWVHGSSHIQGADDE